MPTLVLLRHGKSDWDVPVTDVERPLARRGRRQAPEAGRWLADHMPGLDLAVVSPARRARDTWDLAAAELSEPPPVRVEDEVYGAGAGELLDLLRPLRDERVVLVGHNPAMEELLHALTGQWRAMTTSCLAVLELAGWEADRGRLVAHGRPPAAG